MLMFLIKNELSFIYRSFGGGKRRVCYLMSQIIILTHAMWGIKAGGGGGAETKSNILSFMFLYGINKKSAATPMLIITFAFSMRR